MRLLSALLFSTVLLAQVPTPESVLGHKPGDDFFLATYDESLGYFQKLAASTDKLKLVRVGKTTRGLDWYVAYISSAKNLAELDKYKDTAKKLALVKGLSDADAHALARTGKAIVHIDGGLHATEVAGAQHTIQLAYNLVTKNDAETNAILDNVILVLWFSINPDGQNQVANWYRSNLGTVYEVSPVPGLWQEYIGHDNNRDGYMNNMVESQTITKAVLDYYPQVFYNHHQTAPFPARIWIPPFAEPISANPHPLMWRWVNKFGTSMAAYLDEHDMPGAMHRGRFDDWYPGFVDHVNSFRNTVSFLTETALYRYATPHFYTIDEFPRDKQDLKAEVFYSSPWKGGWWRLKDATNYMLGASMAVLDTAAKSREELLYNRYQAGRDVIKRFETDPPYAYVIPQQQHDLPTAAVLVEKLLINGIEVQQAARDFKVNGETYKAGDWVVLMDQPFASLVKELFEPQHYPDLRPAGAGAAAGGGGRGGGGRGGAAAPPAAAATTPAAPAGASPANPPATTAAATPPAAGAGGRGGGRGGAAAGAAPANPSGSSFETPYDVTGWTLPMQMGVTVVMVVEPVSNEARGALKKIDHVTPIVGKVEGAGPVFAFSHNSNASMKSVNDILNAGGTVSFGKSDAMIYAGGNAASVLKNNGVDAKSMNDTPAGFAAKKIRVGLYEPWAGNIDEGWTKWILEQFHFPFTVMHNDDVRAGHLRAKFDSILLAEMQARQIVDGMQAGSVPGRYAGGIGDEGVEALREFVEQGGTLVTLGNASQFAIDRFSLPVTNIVAGLRSEEFFCSGALLRADVKEHPVTAGMPPQADLLFERNEVFDTKAGFKGTVLASYIANRNPLRSGFLIGAEKIEGKPAALDVVMGQGHVILIGFRTQWRGQSHGTYKLMFNALYYNSSMAPVLAAPMETPPKEGGGRGGGRGRGGNTPATPAPAVPENNFHAATMPDRHVPALTGRGYNDMKVAR
jgi:Zinc carboxypeptidase